MVKRWLFRYGKALIVLRFMEQYSLHKYWWVFLKKKLKKWSSLQSSFNKIHGNRLFFANMKRLLKFLHRSTKLKPEQTKSSPCTPPILIPSPPTTTTPPLTTPPLSGKNTPPPPTTTTTKHHSRLSPSQTLTLHPLPCTLNISRLSPSSS